MKTPLHVSFLFVIALFCVSNTAGAQEGPAALRGAEAVITGPGDIAVGKTIVLDASSGRISGERTEYRWTIEETRQNLGKNVEVIYTPEKPGVLTFRLVVKSIGLDGEVSQDETMHTVVVYKRKVVIIADSLISAKTLRIQADEAIKTGTYVQIVQPDPSAPSLSIEEEIRKILTENKDILSGADTIVLWTEGIAGLQALLRTVQDSNERMTAIRNQTVIMVTERNMNMVARTTRGAVSLLQPSKALIMKTGAVDALLQSPSVKEFLQSKDSNGSLEIESTPSSFRLWNFLSILVNYLLSQGVSAQAVILLLLLPLIATIFSFLKQVVGITTFGLYTPSIIALSFLALGWWVGILFLLFILIMGHLTRTAMKHWRLLYIPKVAIILTVVSLTLLCLVAIGTAAGLTFSRDTIFILLIMSTLSENFLNLKTEEGWRAAMIGILETILGSLFCVFIIQFQTLQAVILAFPELIFLTILINIALGRWTGLRLLEYVRFREVFKHLQAEE
jgi:hypothetical protein